MLIQFWKGNNFMEIKPPTISQVYVPLILASILFGVWQHNYWAGLTLFWILVLYTNFKY